MPQAVTRVKREHWANKGWRWGIAGVLLFALAALNGHEAFSQGFRLQEQRNSGENIAPSFDGWEKNPDGSFNMVFGYFNRNWEEQPDVPIGPNNSVEPGGPDQGQPTHFLPRRNWMVFRARVPKDFGQKELVWTLTVNGKTEKAYATLKPEFMLDDEIIQSLFNNVDQVRVLQNKAPVVKLEGDARRTARVGQPVTLTAIVTDDGIFKPKAAAKVQQGAEQGIFAALGLRVAWYIYRGIAANVTFDPEQFHTYPDYKIYPDGSVRSPWASGWLPPPVPADGKFPVKVSFNAPGEYVVQVEANDGGLKKTQDVAVTVTP